ncbi:unnamed protein product [Pylaiella littoralis]
MRLRVPSGTESQLCHLLPAAAVPSQSSQPPYLLGQKMHAGEPQVQERLASGNHREQCYLIAARQQPSTPASETTENFCVSYHGE